MATRRDPKRTSIRVAFAAVLVGVLVGGSVLVYNTLFGNAAELAIAPLDRDLESLGGARICTIGDGGHIINRQPWSEVYFMFSDSEGLPIEDVVNSVRQTLSRAGYERVEGPYPTDTRLYAYRSDRSVVTETSERYEGFDDGRQVVVTYSLAPSVTVYCHEDWARVQSISSTQTVVQVQLTLPYR